jgi:signal transduction histidine kinase
MIALLDGMAQYFATMEDTSHDVRSAARPSWSWTLDVPKKATLIRVRWPFTIVCSYLLLYSESSWLSPAAVYGFVLLYLLSNSVLYFIDERLFDSSYFFGALVAFDTLFFTASLALSGQASADFYVVCFTTIFLCSICQDLRGLIGVAILSPLLYGYFLVPSADIHEPTLYLRIVFPFVISLFYGYFAQVEYLQQKLHEQTDAVGRSSQLLETAKAQAKETALLLAELEQKTRLWKQADRAREDFLGIMSHELRTPLNVVFGYARLLKDRVLGDISPTQAEAAAKIMSHAREQLMMVTDILEVAAVEAGESVARSEEIRPALLLDEMRDDYEIPEGKDIVLSWNYPQDLPALKTDADKLKHALRNLINNALKFTHRGGVTVTARVVSCPQSIQPSGEAGERRRVEFEVADTGIGIAAEHLTHIFDRFHQIDGSNTRRYGGVGIGLYVVKKLLPFIGAEIQVTSAPGKGSIFTLTLGCEKPGGPARLVGRR